MDEPQKHYAKWKKLDSKGLILLWFPFIWNRACKFRKSENRVGMEAFSGGWWKYSDISDDGCNTFQLY